MASTMSKEEIIKGINRFSDWEWGYNLSGVVRRPNNLEHEALQKLKVNHIFTGIRSILRSSDEEKPLSGLRVLDVGCGEGLFSITARQLGAQFVLGLEPRKEKLEQARFICRALGVDQLEFEQMSVWDITEDIGEFDITLFIGVLYHLDRPFEALCKLAKVTKDIMVVDTELMPLHYPLLAIKEEKPHILYNTVDSGLTYVPTEKAVYLMLKYGGFKEPIRLVARGRQWRANSYTAHYISGHRAAFIARTSSDAIEPRLWPTGILHPPNRVHSAVFHAIIKPHFLFSSVSNDFMKVRRKISESIHRVWGRNFWRRFI